MMGEFQKKIVISVESCKGGTGKSIIALQLAKSLVDYGYATLVIDADLSGTSLTNTLGSNLYPFTEYHPVHEGKYNDNIPKEKQYADFFKDFHKYLREHHLPKFRKEQLNNLSYHVDVKNRVNVYGSNFNNPNKTNEGKNPPLSSTIFTDHYSRWLLEYIKHLCAGFTKTVNQKNVAIVIDNSPGSAGIIPYLREWLTDMGPEHGKILFVTTLDARDMKASETEMKNVADMY